MLPMHMTRLSVQLNWLEAAVTSQKLDTKSANVWLRGKAMGPRPPGTGWNMPLPCSDGAASCCEWMSTT